MIYINTAQTLKPENELAFLEIQEWFENNDGSGLFDNKDLRLLILSRDDGSPEGCSIFYSDCILFSDPNNLIIYLANSGYWTWDEYQVSVIEGIQYV